MPLSTSTIWNTLSGLTGTHIFTYPGTVRTRRTSIVLTLWYFHLWSIYSLYFVATNIISWDTRKGSIWHDRSSMFSLLLVYWRKQNRRPSCGVHSKSVIATDDDQSVSPENWATNESYDARSAPSHRDAMSLPRALPSLRSLFWARPRPPLKSHHCRRNRLIKCENESCRAEVCSLLPAGKVNVLFRSRCGAVYH